MCKTCKGEGGIVIEHGWYAEFRPCPDTNCEVTKNGLAEIMATVDEFYRKQEAIA